jgi:hypothetical protein
MAHKLTSTQPEPARTRIYGSTNVEPLASSNQPEVIPNKVYGSKLTRQIRVRLKGTDDADSFFIRKQDFDETKHDKVSV